MKTKMSKFVGIGLVILLTMLLSGCGESAEETVTPEVEAEYVPVVSVTGEIAPEVWAVVSTQAGGVVQEMLVEPGSEVATGDLLLRLDPTDAQLAVQQSEAALETARAQLALMQAGPRPEQVSVAQAQIEAARTVISQTTAQRNQLWSGATEAEIAAAQARVAAAQAEWFVAREVHDQTMKCYDVPRQDGSEKEVCPALGTLEEQARYALLAAEEALAASQAQVDALTRGSYLQVRTAEAVVSASEAQAGIAQAQLDLLQAGSTEEQVAVSQAAVAQAEAALDAARVALERCEVRAPFGGTVGAVNARAGELIVPGQALLVVGDLATLRVETTDLDEIDVARVTVGQQATITFDGLPDHVFGGHVARISPMADPGAGGVSYASIIELDEGDPAIRWGMTAFVDIEVGE